MNDLESLSRYEVSKDADGTPLKPYDALHEDVFLAFDTRDRCLVELHFPKGSHFALPDEKAAFREHSMAVRQIQNRSFISILGGEETRDSIFYSTRVNDGELVRSYISRLGPLSLEMTIGLVLDFLHNLREVESPELLSQSRLDSAMLMLEEDGTLRLRLIDFGLLDPSRHLADADLRNFMRDFARLMVFLLTGREFTVATATEEDVAAVAQLSSGLRFLLERSIWNLEGAPCSIVQFHEQLKKSVSASVRSFSARHRKKHLKVVKMARPRSVLSQLLLPQPLLPPELQEEYRKDDRAYELNNPFSIQLVEQATGNRLRMQILPPDHVVPTSRYTPVSEDVTRVDKSKHPHLVRVLNAWEATNAFYVAEDTFPGFPLTHALEVKGPLTAAETLILLRHARHALQQAKDCGLDVRHLRPGAFQIAFEPKSTLMDLRGYLERRICSWPSFLLKLRPHGSMSGLRATESDTENQLVKRDGPRPEIEKQQLVALAIDLMTAGSGKLPTNSISPELVALFVELGETIQEKRSLPSIDAFLKRFADCVPEAPNEPSLNSYGWAGVPVSKSERTEFVGEATHPSEEVLVREKVQAVPENYVDPVILAIKNRAKTKEDVKLEQSPAFSEPSMAAMLGDNVREDVESSWVRGGKPKKRWLAGKLPSVHLLAEVEEPEEADLASVTAEKPKRTWNEATSTFVSGFTRKPKAVATKSKERDPYGAVSVTSIPFARDGMTVGQFFRECFPSYVRAAKVLAQVIFILGFPFLLFMGQPFGSELPHNDDVPAKVDDGTWEGDLEETMTPV